MDKEKRRKGGDRSGGPPRLSLTISKKTQANIRIAAAYADMEPNDWARTVLITAADRALQKAGIEL